MRNKVIYREIFNYDIINLMHGHPFFRFCLFFFDMHQTFIAYMPLLSSSMKKIKFAKDINPHWATTLRHRHAVTCSVTSAGLSYLSFRFPVVPSHSFFSTIQRLASSHNEQQPILNIKFCFTSSLDHSSQLPISVA